MRPSLQRVGIRNRSLQLADGNTTFSVKLSSAARTADLSLVIDIYDFDNPVHPEGHLGWWSFPVAGLEETVELTFSRVPGGVQLNGGAAAAHWSNEDFGDTGRLVVNAVLRENTTNAIVDLDRVPAFADPAAMTTLRAALPRDWSQPRYAPVPVLPAAGETVHIVAPDIALRDGVGNLCLELYRLLRQNDVPVMLHAVRSDFAINDIVRDYRGLAEHVGPADRIIYFYSTHDPLLDVVLSLSCSSKVAYFHGVTDPTKLRVFDPELAADCARAIAGLDRLAAFDGLAANSAHSARVLQRALPPARPRSVKVVPPLLVAAGSASDADEQRRDLTLLTVCQIRPHKRVEDVLRLFAALRKLMPEAVLQIIGRAPSRAYRDYLAWVESDELGLPEGAVTWLGSVPQEALVAAYRSAALYVSMSEDEGFCLPLLEAMRHRLPVAAYALPAVVETLGTAGVRFETKDFEVLAGQLARLLTDRPRREALVGTGVRRANELLSQMDGAELVAFLYGTHA